jgi:GNAT superfamily N-acetyltransferase
MGADVRILSYKDAAVLAKVAPDVFDNAIDAQAAKAFLHDPNHHIAVAIDGDVVVGFVSALHYLHPDKPRPELWINEVGVASTHQGGGLGKALMQAMLDEARRIGCAEAWVLTDRGNLRATHLYTAAGGTDSEQVMFTFRLDGA